MKRLNRTIAVAMLTVACAVPCATAAPVWAEEEAWGTEAQEAEVDVVEDESDGTDDDTPAPGAEYDAATGKYANSFRFKDGAPVANGGDEDGISLMSSRADSLITWSYKDGAYRFSNGIVDSRATAIGIDVSEWQDDINWSKVKSAGVDYAILRCGWGADYRFRSRFDSSLTKEFKTTNHLGATGYTAEILLKDNVKFVDMQYIQSMHVTSFDEGGFGFGYRFITQAYDYGIAINPKTGKRFFNEIADRKIGSDAILKVTAQNEGIPPVVITDIEGQRRLSCLICSEVC